MGYICRFLDNETYGADDISTVFSAIIGGGVLAYPEQGTVAQSLDSMTASVMGAGVSEYGGLEVSVSEGTIHIGEGMAFFNAGVSIEVDYDGIDISRDTQEDVYVYLLYEQDLNKIFYTTDVSIPEGDVVVLAKICADGTVLDMRQYAAAKTILNSTNVYYDFEIEMPDFMQYFSEDESYKVTYELPHSGVRYLMLRSVECESKNLEPEEHVIDFQTEGPYKIILSRGATTYYLMIKREGTTLKFAAIGGSTTGPAQQYTFTLA